MMRRQLQWHSVPVEWALSELRWSMTKATSNPCPGDLLLVIYSNEKHGN